MADFNSIPDPFSARLPIPSTPAMYTPPPPVDPEAERRAREAAFLGAIPRQPGQPAVASNATLPTLTEKPDATAFPFVPRTQNTFNVPAPVMSKPLPTTPQEAAGAPAMGVAGEPLGNYPGGQDAGQGQGNTGGSAASFAPVEVQRTVESTTNTPNPEAFQELTVAQARRTNAQEDIRRQVNLSLGIVDEATASPEDKAYAKQIRDQIAQSMKQTVSVEGMLNPESDEMKTFYRNLTKSREQLEKANEDLITFQKEARVDPKRYMKEMPGTERAVNAMLMFMEGMSAAKAMGKGVAVPPVGIFESQINKAIEQDIQFQKQEIESKKEGLANSVNRYKENYALLGNERAATIKTKMDYLTAINGTLNQLKQHAQGRVDSAMLEEKIANNLVDMKKTNVEFTKAVNQMNSVYKTPTPKDMGMTDDEWKRADGISKAYQDQVKDAVPKLDKMTDFKRTLAAAKNGNEAALGILKGIFVKDAQGGTGTISDSDVKVFGYTQSMLNSLKERIARNFKGELPADVYKDLEEYAQRGEDSANLTISRSVGDAIIRAKQVGLRPEFIPSVIPASALATFKNEQLKLQEANKQKK